jgi:hypothetical protein
MGSKNAEYRERTLRKHGQKALDELRARWAAKRRRVRYQRKFAAVYGRPPTSDADHRIVRKMLRGHPITCVCFDCTWGPEECGEPGPRVARLSARPT